jgi:dolichol-phosphate mannosyltransferase
MDRMKMKYSDITLIIPTLNESDNISKMIDLTGKMYPGIRVIVSDDGSKDGTQEIVKRYASRSSRIRLLNRSKEPVHGLTASVTHGAKIAKTKYIIVIDGDLQHPPEKIGEIAVGLRNGNDIVIGTREKDLTAWVWHRRLISKSATSLGRARLMIRGLNCKDVLSGFFGIRTSLAKDIIDRRGDKFQPEGYKILFDLLKQVPRDTKIGEVSYLFGLRKTGQSKLNRRHIMIFLKSMLR